MSYPPRPPMGMPPMPPGMIPQGYNYPPMGMMPMQMNYMPPRPMMRPPGTGAPMDQKKAPDASKKGDDEKAPVTTVFVGNISERAPDAMVRTMLQRCGNVLTWKRVQGASGKLQAFGFCEYEQPEATLRCIRLLNDWLIPDKKLVVKVDAKTKILLEDYKKKKSANKEEGKKGDKKGDEEGEIGDDISTDGLDEFTLREDRVAKAGLDAIMREYAQDLAKEPPKDEKKDKKREPKKEKIKDEGIDGMEIEDETKDLIHREIKSFRDAHKGEDEKDEANQKRAEQRRMWLEERRDRERKLREAEKERDRERERQREKERQRDRERESERHPERSRDRDRDYRSRDKDRSSRTRDRSQSRDREREHDRHDDVPEEEDPYERKRYERKLREKEIIYQERLKVWEARERKKDREYEKERMKEKDKKEDNIREARRMKEFLEDYDDDRDDPKYYKGSALQRRMKEREKEMEADARDRQREKEELDEIRRQLTEEGHPDVDEEMARIERERDQHLMPRLIKEPTPQHSPEEIHQAELQQSLYPKTEVSDEMLYNGGGGGSKSSSSHDGVRNGEPETYDAGDQSSPDSVVSDARGDSSDDGGGTPSRYNMSQEDSSSMPFIGPTNDDQRASKLGFAGLKIGASESPGDHQGPKRKKLTVVDVFNQDDDDDSLDGKKRRLVPLDLDDDDRRSSSKKPVSLSSTLVSSKPTTAEEKRKCIKVLIERIPTAKEELFAYPLDWTMVDNVLMERRIKPWVNKKIVEYIGEEEAQLTQFICQKVMAHSTPQTILDDVAMVLDEESEVFVVKMWRLLIYETEAKKAGLVK